ncbi:hypothetical protein J1N35_019224 [Gossypium stocksii]|uniref:Uncharacterized protein n=1 Tax=Gossypium stocksii TaxID=47602 RepID=A0A9D3VRK8_9ROSI|nr:hypothetical protein J1N35_019224 [Gossypium stocksii]
MGVIGKDFESMNIDELLKNIWSAEETQTMASYSGGLDAYGGLRRQGSLTLPRMLSQNTVDEVWKDVSKEYSIGKDGIGTAAGTNHAGVVREDTQFAGKDNNINGGFFDGFQQGGRTPNFMGNRLSEVDFQASNLPLNVNGVKSNQHQLPQQQQQQPIFPRQPAVGFGFQMPLQSGGQLGSPGNGGGITGMGD